MSLPEGIIVYDKEELELGNNSACNASLGESIYSLQTGITPIKDSQINIDITFFNQSAARLTELNLDTIKNQYARSDNIFEKEEVDRFNEKHYTIQMDADIQSGDFEQFLNSKKSNSWAEK